VSAAGADWRSGDPSFAVQSSLGSAETGCLPPFSAKNSRFENFSPAGSVAVSPVASGVASGLTRAAGALRMEMRNSENMECGNSIPAFCF